MEDAKSKQVTIEEPMQDTPSLDEWTIINDDKEKLLVNSVPVVDEIPGKDMKYHNTNKEGTVVEVIEEIDPTTLGAPSSSQDDDSDRISIISKNHRDKIELEKDIEKRKRITNQLNLQFPVYIHLIATCCFTALIGFTIGCIVGHGKTTQLYSASHPTVGAPKGNVFDDKSVTIESEPYSPDVRDACNEPLSEHCDDLPPMKRVNDQNFNIKNFEKIRTLKNSLHKIKLFLDILCSLIDKNQRENYGKFCTRNSTIFDVIELKDTVEYTVNELNVIDDVSTKKFVENLQLKIENFTFHFFESFFNIVKSLMAKIDQKLVKMRTKLYQRLCLISNTYANKAKILEILNKRQISIENCEIMQFLDINCQEKKHEELKNHQKKKYESKKGHNDMKHWNSFYFLQAVEKEPSEVVGAGQPKYRKNKRNEKRPEDFKPKKKQKFYEQNSSEDKNKNVELSEQYHKKQDSNDSNLNKKYNNNYREFRNYIKNSRENSDHKSDEKLKKKYKKRRDFPEDSYTKDSNFDFTEGDKNQRNKDKLSTKSGSPKGEPKANFLEIKSGK